MLMVIDWGRDLAPLGQMILSHVGQTLQSEDK